jgi:C4-type Zn-finger protein
MTMPNSYQMTRESPCPACGGEHEFGPSDGVPYWDPGTATTFRVVCATTGKLVEVVIPVMPHAGHAALGTATNQQCPVCKKANFFVSREGPQSGSVVVQYLECSNKGCASESMRRYNKAMNIAIPEFE